MAQENMTHPLEPTAEDKVVPLMPRIEAPRHTGQPAFPTPGIYLNMPAEEYHAIHACSASGIGHLSVSSMDYWAMSVLNEERTEKIPKDSGELTPMELGQAYHCFICEGAVEFNKRYAVALDKDTARFNAEAEGKTLCVTIADIRKAIDEAGGKPKGTAKDALIDQLMELDENAMVWDRMVADHVAKNAGKTMITHKLFRRIAIAKAMIDGDPQLKDAFTGGHAEVSIFWYDEKTGIPMKARLDYLKMLHLIDLKSFSNKQGKPIQRAIDMEISYRKYFIPVVVYLEAIEAAKKMVRDTKGAGTLWQHRSFVKAEGHAPVVEAAPVTDAGIKEWFWKWAHQPEPKVIFIFQQTGIAPVTRGREMVKGGTFAVTRNAVQALKRKWRKCALAYGTAPWVDFEPVRATIDEELTFAAADFGDVIYEEETA
jgi:hypothetical protein